MLYLDTNILIYAIEDSKNPWGKDLSDSSVRLLGDVLSCKHHVIISSWTLEELRNTKRLEQAMPLLHMLKKKTTKIYYTQQEKETAKRLNPHFQDELHGILALRAKATHIVTRDIAGFRHFKNRISVVRPEELS